jgi:hypothetical protein
MITSNIKKIICFLLLIPSISFAFSSNDITYTGAKKINGVNVSLITKYNNLQYSQVYISSSTIMNINYPYWHPTITQSNNIRITTSIYPPTTITNSIVIGLGSLNAWATSSINDSYISTSTIATSTIDNSFINSSHINLCWVDNSSLTSYNCTGSYIN